jgi:hypothetical protein
MARCKARPSCFWRDFSTRHSVARRSVEPGIHNRGLSVGNIRIAINPLRIVLFDQTILRVTPPLQGAPANPMHPMRRVKSAAFERSLVASGIHRPAEADLRGVRRRSMRDLLNLLGTIGEKEAGFKIADRHPGGHHDGAWSLDADRFGVSPSSNANGSGHRPAKDVSVPGPVGSSLSNSRNYHPISGGRL